MHFSVIVCSLTAFSLGVLAVPTQDPKTKDLIKEKSTACFKDLDAINAGTSDDTATAAACDSAMAECGAGLESIGPSYTNSGSLTCAYDPKICKSAQKHIENICRKDYDMVGYTSHGLSEPTEGKGESN